MFTAIILPLYNEDNWTYLSQLSRAEEGDRDAFLLADSYNGRNDDGTYAYNSTEAFISINCLDYAGDARSSDAHEAAAAEEAARSSVRRCRRAARLRQVAVPGDARRGPIARPGSADILVVGTTNDPATPYVVGAELSKNSSTATSSPITARATPRTTSRTRA